MAARNKVSNVMSSVSSQIRHNYTPVNSESKFIPVGMSATKRIYLVTWNVHGSDPPVDLSFLLRINDAPMPDIYAIGLQEMGSADWEGAFLNILGAFDYVKVKCRRLLGICTLLFVKRSNLPYVCSIESELTKTGFKGCWGNKGATSIRFDLMGMNLIIINSHLAPHMEGIKERIVNVDNILDGQKFRDRDTDNIMDHDYVFWIGDLNFRLENLSYERAIDLIREEDYKALVQKDQLRLVMEEGLVFEGFHEGELNFPPTYKFDVGTNSYDSSPLKRIPSYTDRILYYYHDTQYGQFKLSAKCLHYRCHSNYRNSDHKPVSAVIEINVMTKGITNPVTFDLKSNHWNKNCIREVVYTVRNNFPTSLWDWIGIYKADFVDLTSHLTYVWASPNSVIGKSSLASVKRTVHFSSVVLNDLPNGEYVLCYLTRKGSLCGISKIFMLGTVTH